MRPGQEDQGQPQQQQEQRVLYTRGNPPERRLPFENNQNVVFVVVPDKVFYQFLRKLYLIAIILILASSIFWLVISGTRCNFGKAVPVPYYVWFLLALLMILLLQCCPGYRYTFPINWTLTLLAALFIALTIASFMFFYNVVVLIILLLLAGVLLGILHMFGSKCPQQVLPGGLLTGCLILVIIVALLVLMFLMIFLVNPVYAFVFNLLLFILLLILIPFHAQFIHGRLGVVPIFDELLCALAIYIHFVLLFNCMLNFYIYHMRMANIKL